MLEELCECEARRGACVADTNWSVALVGGVRARACEWCESEKGGRRRAIPSVVSA